MEYVIGIDAGGTSTEALLSQTDGTLLALVKAGPGNLQRLGMDGFLAQISELVDQLRASIPPTGSLTRIEIGAAGLARDSEQSKLMQRLSQSRIAASYGVQADSQIALFAGTLGRPGLIVIAGTGSIVDGIDGQGKRHRCGGWGYLMGDEGSGYHIGKMALQAAAQAADGRGPRTSLLPRLLQHFGVDEPWQLIEAVYRPPLTPTEVAKLAALVGEEAAQGDGVAKKIIAVAARELARQISTVAGNLGLPPGSLSAFYAGGLFSMGELLLKPLMEELSELQPGLDLAPLPYPPVMGAALLAISHSKDLTEAIIHQARNTAKEFHL
ncbi:MAG: hypothetical protein GX030_08020 [Firmicutes bacterium]|nr:hypothetical protein [Bacillota bacterium]